MFKWQPRRNQNQKQRSAPRRFPLQIEELERRNLLSTALPTATSFDNLQMNSNVYDQSHIIVRWLDNAPTPGPDAVSLGSGMYRINVAPGQSVTQAVSYYEGLAGVDYATPDYQVSLQKLPNDPSFGSLYGLNNTGQTGGTVDADIDAPEAWDVNTGSGKMVVAVIDTGVDYNHPDLAANIWTNPGEIAGNGIDDDHNGYVDDIHGYDFANNDSDPMDDNGHGTHVSGTIGAVGNNGVGVTGINWNVKIMALKFLGANGSGSLSNAVLALNYAVANGAKVSNNSYGGGGFYQAMATAIDNARLAGHIFVAAAGNASNNNDINPSYPASYNSNNVISVAATDSRDALASFSNYGATSVDLAAPGVGILSTTPNNTYSSFSGTSMASPHVAGAAALLWDAHPTWTYSQVIDRLLQTVDKLPGLTGKVATGGRLNIGNALAGTPPPADTSGPYITAVTFSGANSTSISSARVTFSEGILGSTFTAADIAFTNPAGGSIAISSVTAVAGSNTQFDVAFAAQTTSGTYRMVIGPNITDLAGNLMDQNRNNILGEASDTYTATFNINPTFTFTSNQQVKINDLATVTSSIVVTNTFPIQDLNVKVNLTHTYDSDLVITLIAPNGTRILLANRRGGSGDNYTNTTFDDQATIAISSGVAPFSGTYRPEQALSLVNGLSINGTWKLEIRDAARRDTGTLLSWSLVAQSASGAAGASFEGDFGGGASGDTIDFATPIDVSDKGDFDGTTGGTIGDAGSLPSVTWTFKSALTAVNDVGQSDTPSSISRITLSPTTGDVLFAEVAPSAEETAAIETPSGSVPQLEMLGIELI